MKLKRLICLALGMLLLAASAAADEAIIDGKTSDRVHLREGRSEVTASQGLFFTGTRVLCEGDPEGQWVAVTIGAQTGYMKAEYLLRGSMGSAANTQRTELVQEATFLWQRPDAASAVLGNISTGGPVTLLGQTHDGWYYVQANCVYGYIPASAMGQEATAVTMPFSQDTAWAFSSGAGGWATTLVIAPDGTFTGNFADADLGDSDVNYPYGTHYTCYFSGKLSDPVQVDTLRYEMIVERLTWDVEPDTVWFEDGVRYISTVPYGLSQGDTMTLYQPGAAISLMTDDEISWVASSLDNGFVITPVLINENQNTGFCQY